MTGCACCYATYDPAERRGVDEVCESGKVIQAAVQLAEAIDAHEALGAVPWLAVARLDQVRLRIDNGDEHGNCSNAQVRLLVQTLGVLDRGSNLSANAATSEAKRDGSSHRGVWPTPG